MHTSTASISVQEITRERAQLSRKIESLIEEFETKTEVLVTGITYEKTITDHGCRKLIGSGKTTITLDI